MTAETANLPRVAWISALETGVAEIDTEHRRLVEAANALVDAVATRQPWTETVALVEAMRTECFEHFAREERHLASEGFPGVERHATEHRRIEREIDEISSRIGACTELTSFAAELLLAFRELLIDHLLRYDLAYKSHLQARRGR